MPEMSSFGFERGASAGSGWLQHVASKATLVTATAVIAACARSHWQKADPISHLG